MENKSAPLEKSNEGVDPQYDLHRCSIRWTDKGYGFAQTPNGKCFVHVREVKDLDVDRGTMPNCPEVWIPTSSIQREERGLKATLAFASEEAAKKYFVTACRDKQKKELNAYIAQLAIPKFPEEALPPEPRALFDEVRNEELKRKPKPTLSRRVLTEQGSVEIGGSICECDVSTCLDCGSSWSAFSVIKCACANLEDEKEEFLEETYQASLLHITRCADEAEGEHYTLKRAMENSWANSLPDDQRLAFLKSKIEHKYNDKLIEAYGEIPTVAQIRSKVQAILEPPLSAEDLRRVHAGDILQYEQALEKLLASARKSRGIDLDAAHRLFHEEPMYSEEKGSSQKGFRGMYIYILYSLGPPGKSDEGFGGSKSYLCSIFYNTEEEARKAQVQMHESFADNDYHQQSNVRRTAYDGHMPLHGNRNEEPDEKFRKFLELHPPQKVGVPLLRLPLPIQLQNDYKNAFPAYHILPDDSCEFRWHMSRAAGMEDTRKAWQMLAHEEIEWKPGTPREREIYNLESIDENLMTDAQKTANELLEQLAESHESLRRDYHTSNLSYNLTKALKNTTANRGNLQTLLDAVKALAENMQTFRLNCTEEITKLFQDNTRPPQQSMQIFMSPATVSQRKENIREKWAGVQAKISGRKALLDAWTQDPQTPDCYEALGEQDVFLVGRLKQDYQELPDNFIIGTLLIDGGVILIYNRHRLGGIVMRLDITDFKIDEKSVMPGQVQEKYEPKPVEKSSAPTVFSPSTKPTPSTPNAPAKREQMSSLLARFGGGNLADVGKFEPKDKKKRLQ